jgi:RNA polymerase sigma-70 factor (ECF subfamily)
MSEGRNFGILNMNVGNDMEQPGPAKPEADRIVEEVLAGDTEAFAGLVRLFQESVWRIGASLLRDRDATENLVQQVFVDAYLHLDQYEPGTDFGAWIRTVARNRLRKELRSASREDRRLAAYRERLAERLRVQATDYQDDSETYMNALRGCRQQLSRPLPRNKARHLKPSSAWFRVSAFAFAIASGRSWKFDFTLPSFNLLS